SCPRLWKETRTVPGVLREKRYQTVWRTGPAQLGSPASCFAPTVVPATFAGSVCSTTAFARASFAGGCAAACADATVTSPAARPHAAAAATRQALALMLDPLDSR